MGCTSKWYEKIELRTGFKNVHNFSKLELSFIQGKTVLSTMSVIYANDNFLREKKVRDPPHGQVHIVVLYMARPRIHSQLGFNFTKRTWYRQESCSL